MHHAEPEDDQTIVRFTFSHPEHGDSDSDSDGSIDMEDSAVEEVLVEAVATGEEDDSTHKTQDPSPDDEEEAQKLRADQRVKIACQVIAVNIWATAPDTRIAAMKKHPAILNFAGAKDFNIKVVHRWLSEVAPPHLKTPGRPKKNNSTDGA